MKYRVTHQTTYRGDQPVSVCHNEAWLKPRDTPFQTLDDHQLESHPSPTSLAQRRDYFGNNVWSFSFNRGYDSMTVTSTSEVSLVARVANHDFAVDAMRRVKAPTLLLWGGADPLLPPSAAETLAKYLTGTEVSKVIMPDVGHYPPVEVPERFADIMVAYVESATPKN